MPIGFRPLDLVVIFVLALLIFGPKKLPELSRSIGTTFQQLKKGISDISHPQEPEEATVLPPQKTAYELRMELEDLERELASKQAASAARTTTHSPVDVPPTEKTTSVN